MGNTPIENNPGGPGDLSDLWPILLKTYGLILAVIALLCFLLWLVNWFQRRSQREACLREKRLSSALWQEYREEKAEADNDLWFTDEKRRAELYSDFNLN